MNFVEKSLAQNPSKKDLLDIVELCDDITEYVNEAVKQLLDRYGDNLTYEELFEIFYSVPSYEYKEEIAKRLLERSLVRHKLRSIIDIIEMIVHNAPLLEDIAIAACKKLWELRPPNDMLTEIIYSCVPYNTEMGFHLDPIGKVVAELAIKELMNRVKVPESNLLIAFKASLFLSNSEIEHWIGDRLLKKKRLSNKTLRELLDYESKIRYKGFCDRIWKRLSRRKFSGDDRVWIACNTKYSKLGREIPK